MTSSKSMVDTVMEMIRNDSPDENRDLWATLRIGDNILCKGKAHLDVQLFYPHQIDPVVDLPAEGVTLRFNVSGKTLAVKDLRWCQGTHWHFELAELVSRAD